MRKQFIVFAVVSIIIVFITAFPNPVNARSPLQAGTVVIATVTGTPVGAFITVRLDQPQINVRSGPGTAYPKVGVLLAGQQVPAKGKSPGGDWILIDYPGILGGLAWVYSPLVDTSPGELPVVEPPPTPTLLYTTTINPTLAAQFVVTSEPSRLPTYTLPPPLAIPTFIVQAQGAESRVPMGLVIILIAAMGAFIGLLSVVQR